MAVRRVRERKYRSKSIELNKQETYEYFSIHLELHVYIKCISSPLQTGNYSPRINIKVEEENKMIEQGFLVRGFPLEDIVS
jgi:hypothetical protein